MSDASPSLDTFRDIVLKTTHPILAVDTEGVIRFANEPFGNISGYTVENTTGTSLETYFQGGKKAVSQFRSATGSSIHATLERNDGSSIAVEIKPETRLRDGQELLILTLEEAVPEHHEGTDRLVRHLFDRHPDPLLVLDAETKTVVNCNEPAMELLNRSESDILDQPINEFAVNGDAFGTFLDTIIENHDGQREQWDLVVRDGSKLRTGVSATPVKTDGKHLVLLSILEFEQTATAVEKTQDEPADIESLLEKITTARRRLSSAEDTSDVATACITALNEVLGFDLGCLRLRTDTNELKVEAMTPDARTLVSGNPGFQFALSEAGRAYRTGDPVVATLTDETGVSDMLDTRLHYPIGDHGVLSVATTDGRSVSRAQQACLRFFAGGLEVALDRIDTERHLREQCETLRTHQRQIETIRNTTGLTEQVITEVVAAGTREEIESLVCRRLSESSVYAGAWIAQHDSIDEQLSLSESAGPSAGDWTPLTQNQLAEVANGVLMTASETGGSMVLDVTDTVSPTDESTSVRLVPLTSGDRVFGLLGVHVADTASFETAGEQSLRILGDTISFAFQSVENEHLLLSDDAVELELQVTDDDCLAVALSDALNTYISMERTVKNANNEHLSYIRIADTDPDHAVEVAHSLEDIRDCRLVAEHDDGCLLEVMRESSGAEVMIEFGATMLTAEAEDGVGRLVIETPQSVDIRRVVQAYQEYNPDSELLSKREVNRPVRTADQLRSELESTLTEKQRSALSAAYYSGYYEWPRESTAEEVADSMDITASTLHQHLRRAHHKILSALLESSVERQV